MSTAAVVALGVLTLALRPVSAAWIVPIAAVGAAGIAWPVADRSPKRAAGALSGGLVAVVLLGAAAPPAVAPTFVLASVAAAFCEEAFFRRLVYGWIAPRGNALAVASTAVLFAVAHVPVYGLRVLPIDLAAGVLFGWQRWASGTWLVPAITHAVANVLAST